MSKLRTCHYIIEKVNDLTFSVKYLPRKGFSQTFYYPPVEDTSVITLEDVVAKLQKPMDRKTKRAVSVLVFNYNFEFFNRQ